MKTAVRFQHVSRHFGAVRAVDDVTLDIAEGEFFAMLGPSGSGKTTCLRLIAGFEQPTSGHLEIFGETAEGVPPYRRNVNTVFQDYALFPHMNVLDNVGYGLMVKGMGKAERDKRSLETLDLVELAGFEARRPGQLSGGQRQRVALARALVNEPKVLLLDEPLGALDLKLREQMQVELKTLQRNLGITFVFVTHDQGEALSMADKVAIFNEGKIVQVGAPEDIYERPRRRFVADFVGSSNVLNPQFNARTGGPHKWASLRPEKISVWREGGFPDASTRHCEAKVISVHYQGAVTRIATQAGEQSLSATIPSGSAKVAADDIITLAWSAPALHVMEDEA
jgi:putative spermidine/putrescine transport system ATP-binding protein